MTALMIGVMVLAGILLLAIEFFLVPGFSVPGAAGILFIGYAVYLAYTSYGFAGASLSFAVSVIVSIILLRVALRSRTIRLFGLEMTQKGNTASDDYSHLTGKTGVALTDLRPVGTAEIDGVRYDVVTDGEYIDEKNKITVTSVEGSRIIVTTYERR